MTRIKQAGPPLLIVTVIAAFAYLLGTLHSQRTIQSVAHAGEASTLVAQVAESTDTADRSAWSPTKPYPTQEVYYPGTEELQPDEMRVIACGSGMPMPRAKQAAACFLIELGNGEKLIFD